MEKSQIRPFSDKMKHKITWYKNLDGYLQQPMDSKRYVPFMSNHP